MWQINADEHPELLRALGVLGVPTLLLYQGTTEITRRTGAQPLDTLRTLFQAAYSGEAPPQPALQRSERLLRLAIAAVLLALGMANGSIPVLLVAAGLVAFSAVYDRCPVWQALAPRLKALFRQ